MSFLFQEILRRPLFNLIVFLYNIIPFHDYGIAIIILTVIIRFIFMPLSIKTARSQKAMNDLAPEVAKIKEQFKNDKTAQSQAIMNLYKEKKVNPLGGCLPLLIQLPILIALYQSVLGGVNGQDMGMLYGFIDNPGVINKTFLGLIDIASKSHILAILAGILQFIQSKISAVGQMGSKEMTAINGQMLYFFPIMIIIIGWNLPAGLMIYWVTSTLFGIGEQWYIRRNVHQK